MSDTPIELRILARAREIISDPERWTQRTYARDADDRATDPYAMDAVCWCGLGAVMKAARQLNAKPGDRGIAIDLLYKAAEPAITVVFVNDNQGHAAVLALFDKALEGMAP